mmetsp:Transcript_33518/g.65896  ORF Transcript_33518/g.65896 Transcript_33518/m.65896 type:complete len:214 (-) Transcript_33518:3576-4217(-)
MFIMLALLGGFMFSWHIMLSTGNDGLGESYSNFLAILTGSRMLMSDWDADTLYTDQHPIVQGSSVAAFCIYLLAVPVVCMNLLIAIMSDSYDRIKDSEIAEFYVMRTQIVQEVDSVFGGVLKWLDRTWGNVRGKRCYPKFLHVRRPKDHVESGEWQGKIKEMQRFFLNELTKQQQLVKELKESHGKQLEHLRQTSNQQLDLLKQLTSAQTSSN